MSQPAIKIQSQPFRERRGVPATPPQRIGHVVSVNGPRAVVVLERAAQPALRADPPRVQIGALVKITTPASSVVGLVTAVTTPMPGADSDIDEIGLLELNLAGEIVMGGTDRRLTFKRGVTSPPSIGDAVLLVDRHDLTRVYAPPALATIKVGTLYQDPAVQARLRVDDLLSKHFVVVGSTGSGKSCALTTILQRILDDYRYAHIVVLDIHNEYQAAFAGKVEAINLNNFTLPFWLLNFQELTAALTTSDDHRDAETEILGEAVVYAKKRYSDQAASRTALVRKTVEPVHMTVETPSPFRLSDVIAYIDEQLGKLERTQLTLPYRKLKTRIETMVADQRYNFMFGSLTVQDTMSEILARLFRVPSDGKPITVLDLSVVPAEILDVVISVISRLAFDIAVWSKGGLPTLIICEEAHRYVPAVDRDQFFGPTRQALARIAKEGRKYGISLALVTQRPSELDPTILSQCSTVIALRLSSDRDQQVMRSSTHEGVLDLLDFLPLLGDREAIIMGQGVSMPMRIMFDDLDNKTVPRNLNSGFSKSWKTPNMDRQELDAIVARWRHSGREKT
jgi:DNA helicase HerA-like ATPase